MIDKQKIQEAANNYIGHEPEIDEGCNVSARREAFKMALIGSRRISGIAARKNQRKASLLSLSFAILGNTMRLIAHHGLKIGKNIVAAIILWRGAIYQIY